MAVKIDDLASKLHSEGVIPLDPDAHSFYHPLGVEIRLMEMPEGLGKHLNTDFQTLAVVESIGARLYGNNFLVGGRVPGVDIEVSDLDILAILDDIFREKGIDAVIHKPNYLTAKIEPTAPRQNPENPRSEKQSFESRSSLDRVIQAGYQRHLTPAEHFEIKFLGVEDSLPRSIIPIYRDMMDSFGEFLGLIRVLTKDKKRYLTTHNKIKDGRYDTETFDFEPIEIGDLNGYLETIDELAPQLVKQFYGRNLRHFPKQVREGEHIILPNRQSQNREVKLYKPTMWIIQEDSVRPVGSSIGVDGFYLSGNLYDGSSRGYVEKNISTENKK